MKITLQGDGAHDNEETISSVTIPVENNATR